MERVQGNLFKGEAFASLLLRLRAQSFDQPKLLKAIEQTPRQHFALPGDADYACTNRIVPIDCGEYIERLDEQIAIITALKLEANHRVLEIGTGSGFTAAVMARLVARIMTIERYKTLANKAQNRFQDLKLNNVIMHHADAHHGLAAHYGTFDRIIIWPAWTTPPQIFLDKLAGGGQLIVPIGNAEQEQILTLFRKNGSRIEKENLFPVRYQPMLDGVAHIL